jgi:regulator of replication initiation timing
MLTKDIIASTYRETDENSNLDDWQLNCLRAVCNQSIQAIELLEEVEQLKQDLAQLRINKIADNVGEMYRIKKMTELQAENEGLKEEVDDLVYANTALYGENERLRAVLGEINRWCEEYKSYRFGNGEHFNGGVNACENILSIIYRESAVIGEKEEE